MNIVFFSMTPLFRDFIMGGSQKNLRDIAIYLAKKGHRITVLATGRIDTSERFSWHPRVAVIPIFRFKQPYPNPYATPAFHIASAIQDVGEQLKKADRFYIHDGAFVFPYVYRRVPTVASLQDVVYSETLQGAFLFQGDTIIVNSQHTKNYYLYSVGRFFPGLKNKIKVVPTGFDWKLLQPTRPQKIFQIIRVNPEKNIIVLHPHRPEESKGLSQTIEVVDILVHQCGMTRIKTLVPQWLDTNLSAELQNYYQRIKGVIAERKLSSNFIFHRWIPVELMPEYYSLGRVTLCLGSYVETFGNVPYESLGCGTPAIVSRVGPHREILPESYIHKVNFGDIKSASLITEKIIRLHQRTPKKTISYLHRHYPLSRMIEAYSSYIINAKRHRPPRYHLALIDNNTKFSLAPWCFSSSNGIYHDFRVSFTKLEPLELLVRRFPDGFNFSVARKIGIKESEIFQLYREGFLVPR